MWCPAGQGQGLGLTGQGEDVLNSLRTLIEHYDTVAPGSGGEAKDEMRDEVRAELRAKVRGGAVRSQARGKS